MTVTSPPSAAAARTVLPSGWGTGDLVLPLGHYLGANHQGDGGPASHVVRVGQRLHEFDDAQVAVWGMAHGVPGDDHAGPWTAAAAVGAARALGVSIAHEVFDDLLARPALVLFDDISGDDVARSFRLRGLLRGLGPGPDGRALLGPAPGQPAAAVDGFTFEVWKWGPHCDDLWHLCQILEVADPDHRDAMELLGPCLESVQVLVAHGAGYLDVARA